MKLQPWQQRYKVAYDKFQFREYPSASKDYGTLPPKFPDVTTANGLTRFACDFIKFEGYRATRINVQGRLVEKATRTESGASFMDKTWMTSATRKGAADVSSTINGRSVMLEVKIGKDQPSEKQLKEATRERRAGGIYEFVYTPDDVLAIYDAVINNTSIPDHSGTNAELKARLKFGL